MKHLTTMQIQQYVDGSADYMTQATCTNHLAVCHRCRKEADMQKAILRTARQSGLMMPSRSFTRRVMSRIDPSRSRIATRWVLDNMGAMFAMMAVLGVTGSVIVGSRGEEGAGITMPAMDLSAGSQRASELWNGFSGFVGEMLGMISLPQMSGDANIILVVTSVVALILLDRILRGKADITAKH